MKRLLTLGIPFRRWPRRDVGLEHVFLHALDEVLKGHLESAQRQAARTDDPGFHRRLLGTRKYSGSSKLY